MMIVEGIIAMIWAAGGLAIYNMFPELMAKSPNLALEFITKTFLGKGMGGITLIAVIILAITSGDTGNAQPAPESCGNLQNRPETVQKTSRHRFRLS